MAQITRISPIVAGGASGSTPTIAQLITHDLISRGQINLLTAADGQRITGQILGDMIGSAFDAHRGFATMTAVAASGIALRAICMHQPASSAATSALQSRRATIIPTMNAATAQFTRQANLSMDIGSGGGPVSVGSGTHSIAIPLSWGPATQGPETVYTITSLANSAAIFSGAGNSGLLALSGVALRGLQASRNYTGGSAPTITYDMYTAIL